MHPPLRIAILECDTPLDRTKQKYGGYGGVFASLLEAGAAALELPKSGLQISKFDVVTLQEYPDIAKIDAILITGARFNAFDDTDWIVKLVQFTADLLTKQDRVRVIGCCFGHQIIGRALGVPVERSEVGWEAAVTPIHLSDEGKKIFKKDTLALHQMHRDKIPTYPPEVRDLGHTSVCKTQGMYLPKRLITVQGHPEFTQEIVEEILEARHKIGIFDDKTFEDAQRRVGNPHDGVVVSQAFIRFLLDE